MTVVRCRSDGWLQGGSRAASRIIPEPLFVCYGDGQTEMRQEALLMMMFADDIVFFL